MSKVLTIVIPSYNVEQYLNKGLATLADNRFDELLEVLIINDGSTDSTAQIAEQWMEKYPAIIKLVNKENGGHGSVINEGIRLAKGKYFRVIDGDDWVITDNLLQLLEQMKTLDADIVADVKRDVDMTTLQGDVIPLPDSVIVDKQYNFDDITVDKAVSRYFMIHNFSVKTDILKQNQVKVLEKVFYEDSEYVLKATALAKTIIFKEIEIYQYMIGNVNQSVSTANFVKRYAHFDAVTKAMLAFCEQQKTDYAAYRTRTVILTQLYISLIYNEDRKQGRQQAKELMVYLKNNHIRFYHMIKNRYRLDLIMHRVGIDYEKLQKLRKLAGKI